MKISVIVCTWNRCHLLRATLEQMTQLVIPRDVSWDVFVVDNHSQDETGKVVAEFEDRLPVTRVLEEKQGLSYARNRALEESSGDLLLWVDDDVLVGSQWLEEYARAARDYPDASLFGGPVEPWFETKPPLWIERHFNKIQGAFAVRQFGDSLRLLSEGEEPFGANMGFRRNAAAGLLFDPKLGRTGDDMMGGEEVHYFRALRERTGHPGVWVGKARVRHYITGDRLTKRYVREYYVGYGRSLVRRDGLPPGRYLWGSPGWAWKKFVRAKVKEMVLSPFKNRAWVESFLDAAVNWGVIVESADHRRRMNRGGLAE